LSGAWLFAYTKDQYGGKQDNFKKEPLSGLHLLPVLQQNPLQHVPPAGLRERQKG
jgi:hypothetical protein